ncbi:MAG: CoA transferase subunit A [Dehalococcoidia bacterium]|nr:CoA transferase subunit A [Dehalococcoidia bacterium]
MAIDKTVGSIEEAIADIKDGATIMFGGFAGVGIPIALIRAIRDKGVKNLTAICNDATGAWSNPVDVDMLVKSKQVARIIGSFMSYGSPKKITSVEQGVIDGDLIFDLVPQGTLAERIRIAGAGLGGCYTPVGAGTLIAKGKETKVINGKEMILELPLTADFACIKARKADRFGNLVYHGSARNFNPVMATAAKVTIAEVEEIVEIGELDPDFIHTPGIFVNRVVKTTVKAAGSADLKW